MSDKEVYFITGGGTGGHIYPAIAVADEIFKQGNSVYYVGNPDNLEYGIVKQKPYGDNFLSVNVHGMPRKISFSLFSWTIQLGLAVFKCIGYISKYNPKAVFGTGGYVSAPILIACMLKKVPYMMHDCDAQPGLVTRKLAPHAKAVSLAFECAKSVIKNGKFYINGNPIRKEFRALTRPQARKILGLSNSHLTVCIMGGSQGARAINDAAVEILKTLTEKYDIQVIFQTGKKNFERVIEQLIKIYPEYEADNKLIVKPYFDDMVTVLKSCDIAVSRAGSLSLSEIEASGVASILIPYPHAASDHQRKNAQYMVEKGASLYIEDCDVNEHTLLENIVALATNKEKLVSLQNSALKLARYDGVEKIVEQLESL